MKIIVTTLSEEQEKIDLYKRGDTYAELKDKLFKLERGRQTIKKNIAGLQREKNGLPTNAAALAHEERDLARVEAQLAEYKGTYSAVYKGTANSVSPDDELQEILLRTDIESFPQAVLFRTFRESYRTIITFMAPDKVRAIFFETLSKQVINLL